LKPLGNEEEYFQAARHAIEVAERYLVLNPDDALAISRIANDLVAIGEGEKGLEYAERAYKINPHVCRYNVACANVLTGNTERALNLLEEHARAGAVHVDWLEKDSDWEAVRDLPRFRKIVEIAS
jgi:tetratricopeptide (TPR) repeat protein